jgi:sterol desaturase/sphingolipid hydroxylase (fatty acid hydroxylase superfamily)
MQNKLKKEEWNWHPQFPIENNPIFVWPFDFKKIIKWYIPMWLTFSETIFCLLIALIFWNFLQPTALAFKEINFQLILYIYLRNVGLTFFIAGGLHFYLYYLRGQENLLRYDTRDLSKGKRFFLGSQLKDNIFWTIISGVTIWTLYEVLFMWSYANNFIIHIFWKDDMFLFCLVFFFMFTWMSVHFYFIHRLLHSSILYKLFHSVHHRNTNTGPWSGISMHPIEHIFYFSSVLIHFIIPSHPLHILFHLIVASQGAIIGHAGFDAIIFKKNKKIALAHFYHQLHHRYFECNYGALEVPFDLWFGTFHDGTFEKEKYMRAKRLKIHKT